MGACTTTSTMFGVRRITSCTTARSSSFKFAASSSPGVGSRRRTAREQPRHHRIALLRAGHRLHHVAREGRMQIAEEADPAAVLDASTSARETLAGFAIRSGFTGWPSSSTAWNHLPSRNTLCSSSRPSTVLGCVPAATRIDLRACHSHPLD